MRAEILNAASFVAGLFGLALFMWLSAWTAHRFPLATVAALLICGVLFLCAVVVFSPRRVE